MNTDVKDKIVGMKKVRITVVRKVQHLDLSERYENLIEHACDMQEGQTFISIDCQKPEGMCESAWQKDYNDMCSAMIYGEKP